jgi:hypothetical protein
MLICEEKSRQHVRLLCNFASISSSESRGNSVGLRIVLRSANNAFSNLFAASCARDRTSLCFGECTKSDGGGRQVLPSSANCPREEEAGPVPEIIDPAAPPGPWKLPSKLVPFSPSISSTVGPAASAAAPSPGNKFFFPKCSPSPLFFAFSLRKFHLLFFAASSVPGEAAPAAASSSATAEADGLSEPSAAKRLCQSSPTSYRQNVTFSEHVTFESSFASCVVQTVNLRLHDRHILREHLNVSKAAISPPP